MKLSLVISSKDEKEISWKGQRLLNKEKRVSHQEY